MFTLLAVVAICLFLDLHTFQDISASICSRKRERRRRKVGTFAITSVDVFSHSAFVAIEIISMLGPEVCIAAVRDIFNLSLF